MPQSREEMLAKKRAWQRAWYLAHPEESNARLKAQYQKHRAKRLAKDKAKRQANRDAINAAARERDRAKRQDPTNARAARERKRMTEWAHRDRLAHPEKYRALKQQRRIANPEKYRAQMRQYAKNRRARKAQALSTLSSAQEQELYAAKGYRCDYCGKKDRYITTDHLSPLGVDGPDTLWNVTVACRSCNSKKGRGPILAPVQPLLLTMALPKKKKG